MTIKPCWDSSALLTLYSAHQLVAKSLRHAKPAEHGSARSGEAGAGHSSPTGTIRALHMCLAYACSCYFNRVMHAAIV
jgi:hypothetical protein